MKISLEIFIDDMKVNETVVHELPTKPSLPALDMQPACKARRFLLVDGETADIQEGIRWKDGSVCLDPFHRNSAWFYDSWGVFKAAFPGSGVQWIDQEVAE